VSRARTAWLGAIQSALDVGVVGACRPAETAEAGVCCDGYLLRLMSEGPDRSNSDVSLRLRVNFQEARRRIEKLEEFPTSVRARALAAYVGIFDLADANGCVTASSDEIATTFRVSRVSWLQYRGLLERAGLLEVDARHGGVRRSFRLVPPAPAASGPDSTKHPLH
jgi:hypothetical protein